MVQCEDGSFYTGYSKDVESRMKLHRKGKGARYLRLHKPKKLVYVEKFDSKVDAMRREKQIKTLNRQQKLELTYSQLEPKYDILSD